MWGRLNVGTVRLFKDRLKFLSSFLYSDWLAKKQLIFPRGFFIPLLILKEFNANIIPGSYQAKSLGSNKNCRRVAAQVPRLLAAACLKVPNLCNILVGIFSNDVFLQWVLFSSLLKFPNMALSRRSRLKVETATSVPVGALSWALFLCFDGGADVSGLRQYPSYECWVLPCPPPLIPPPQQ